MEILDTRQNLNAMVLKHEQQIKDIAAHLLELRRWGSPMMEFKREKKEWVGLTEEDINSIDFPESGTYTTKDFIRIIEANLKEKNT